MGAAVDLPRKMEPITEADRFSSLAPSVQRASTVTFDTLDAFLARASRLPDGFSYGTTGTPTHRHLERRIAGLDQAHHAVVVPSGQAAIVLVMMALLKAGDHLLISDSAYGPAQTFALEHMAQLGVDVQRYDPCVSADDLRAMLRTSTRMVWMESPGSITMEVQDVARVADQARRVGALTVIDNTWASPLFFSPLSCGVDVCIHACTKYMGGHSDLLMGSISTNDLALYERLRHLQSYMGLAASASDCFLVERGLDTLALRMQAQSANALEVAHWLEAHASVTQVLHPALESSRFHGLWRSYFTGSGAVFSFMTQPASLEAHRTFFTGLHTLRIGASWGSVHSLLAFYPAALQQGRAFPSVNGAILRVSVGLEGAQRVIADLDEALARFDRVRR